MEFYCKTVGKYAQQKGRHRCREGIKLQTSGSQLHTGYGAEAVSVSFILEESSNWVTSWVPFISNVILGRVECDLK